VRARSIQIIVFASLLALMGLLFCREELHAQTPRDGQSPYLFRIPLLDLPNAEASSLDQAVPDPATLFPPLIIDTDPGVDDAVALAWLLSQPEAANIKAIVSVAGNTTVENATQNIFTILDLVGNPPITVIEGAGKPLNEKLSSTGKMIHGPDGLWGVQSQSASIARVKDARGFYCSAADKESTTILALGPLTNIASAIRHCRSEMLKYDRIVILGGAKFGGNTTPVAEFNIWQDPDAAKIVFDSGIAIDPVIASGRKKAPDVGMDIHLVPLDTYSQLGFDLADLAGLATSQMPIFSALAPAVGLYAGVQGFPFLIDKFAIPDLVAAMYTVKPGLVEEILSGQVEVVERPELVRGQTVIGFGVERAPMNISDRELSRLVDEAFAMHPFDPNSPPPPPALLYALGKINELLLGTPNNARVLRTIFGEEMHNQFMNFVISGAASSVGDSSETNQPLPDTIYLPSITAD
jgi:inosine-uridine nucleoside N-ribohydrolase